MANVSSPESPLAWKSVIEGAPGFAYGFMVGAFSSYCANWAWDKFKPRKKNPHLSLEQDEHGTRFTGLMSKGNEKEFLRILRAASTVTSNKSRKGSSYKTPPGGISSK